MNDTRQQIISGAQKAFGILSAVFICVVVSPFVLVLILLIVQRQGDEVSQRMFAIQSLMVPVIAAVLTFCALKILKPRLPVLAKSLFWTSVILALFYCAIGLPLILGEILHPLL